MMLTFLVFHSCQVNIRATLAKSVQKGKKNMEDHKFCISEKDKTKTAKSELIPFESLSPFWSISPLLTTVSLCTKYSSHSIPYIYKYITALLFLVTMSGMWLVSFCSNPVISICRRHAELYIYIYCLLSSFSFLD